MRHLDSRYGPNPAIVQGAIQKNTNDPNTAPTVLVTLLLPHHVSVFAERRGEADPLLVVTDGAPGLIAGADPRRNGDDYPMTSLSDGLGPQTGLTGPPPGEAQASLSHRSRGLAAQSAWRAEGAGRPEPSSRPTRRRRSRPVGQPAPEGNDSGGQHRRPACRRRRRPIASRAGAEGAGADRGHRRIDAGDIDAGETWGTETSAHRIEGEADPLLVVTDGAPGLIADRKSTRL